MNANGHECWPTVGQAPSPVPFGEPDRNNGQIKGKTLTIERAFRISKTDLRIRPMYHRRRRRIEAHVLVAFVAYTIYKELERRLAGKKIQISPKRAAELTQTIYEMTFRYPDDPEDQRILLKMDPEQRQLYNLIW